LEVLLPSTEATAIQDNRQHLLACDAVLFYYAHGNELWLRSQLSELRKATGYGRQRPFRAKGIYVTLPETPQKQLLMTREAEIIKHFSDFKPDLLRGFLHKLRTG
jgi:hypothetical protein